LIFFPNDGISFICTVQANHKIYLEELLDDYCMKTKYERELLTASFFNINHNHL